MATFTFWYSETYTYKTWFEADNEEHARELLRQVEDGELSVEELPQEGSKDKGYEMEIAYETLEEIPNE